MNERKAPPPDEDGYRIVPKYEAVASICWVIETEHGHFITSVKSVVRRYAVQRWDEEAARWAELKGNCPECDAAVDQMDVWKEYR